MSATNLLPRPFNKYIGYLTLFTFLALYIICFVFLFQDNSEIISFVFLTAFSIFFLLFVIDTIGSYLKNFNITAVTGYIWLVLFSSVAFKIASLLLVLLMFRSIYNIKEIIMVNPIVNSVTKNKKSKIPPKYMNMINDYKILFIINMSVIIALLLLLMYNYVDLNTNFFNKYNTFMELGTFDTFTPLIFPVIILLATTRLAFSSAYEVYIGNELFKVIGKRVG
jgi:hypothetical protein